MTSPDILNQTAAFIAGKWVTTGKTFPVLNPANGQDIARVADAGADEASAAITAARTALPGWKAMLPAERSKILQRWHALITQHTDALAAILSRENGKPLAEAKGEIAFGAASVEWFAAEARRAYGRVIPPFKQGARSIVTLEPVGVCAAITPWNFPHSMITRKVAPALAAGCTVVLKPAEDTPLSALALAALAQEAGLPAGVLNVLPASDAKTVGHVLSTHPDVAKLSFTGSTAVGRLLAAQCAPTLKRLSLELGGNAPFIVFDDADIDAAIKGAIASKFRNAGQTCVCANRFYVQRGIYDAFADRLSDAAKALKLGDAFEDGVAVGPLINEKGLEKVESLVADALQKGGTLACGGARDARGGLFYAPTVILNAQSHMRMQDEEIFGPVAPVFAFETEQEALKLANRAEHGLAAYVYTRDLGRAFRMSEGLEYGMVGVNEGLVSSETAPFGGVKQSGYGREGGAEGIHEYLSPKYALIGGV